MQRTTLLSTAIAAVFFIPLPSSPSVPPCDPTKAPVHEQLTMDFIERPAETFRTWLEPLRRCGRRGNRRFCDGPRVVPAASGEAAERAERFGLGTPGFYSGLLRGAASHEVLSEVGGEAAPDLAWPVPGKPMGRGFGYVRGGALAHRLHRGIDIPAPTGTPVVAVNDGLVVFADNAIEGYGNLVVVLHADDTRSYYAHLSSASVAVGERVERGQELGAVGSTGLAYGPHLHFEWLQGRRPRNPVSYFADRPMRGQQVEDTQEEQHEHEHDELTAQL